MVNDEIVNNIAETLYQMIGSNVDSPKQRIFDIWVRSDRVVVVINPSAKSKWTSILGSNFKRRLSLMLQGREVLVTQPDQRGLYLQIALHPVPAVRLEPLPLDLATQPSPIHVPIGMTKRGPFWIDFVEGDSYLIGGSRGMGKTMLSHAWIQALIHGGATRLYLWDGKNGAEYTRYSASDKVIVARNLEEVLIPLKHLIDERETLLLQAGVPGVAAWNARHTPAMEPLAVFVDEAAFIPEGMTDLVKDLVARGRSYGVHPVIATQRPGVQEVQALVKANLTTRIAFPVPSVHESGVILGRQGANRLPKIPGRVMMFWKAREVVAQTFVVTLPTASEASAKPLGEDLEILKAAVKDDGKVTLEVLTERWRYKPWSAQRKLADYVSRGWVAKDPTRKNGHYVTEELRNWLTQN